MVSTPDTVAAVGKVVSLTIQGLVEGELSPITVKATVCHSHRAQDSASHFTGMAFHSLTQQDKLVLSYLTNTPRP
jgi:hypothetical protein